MLRTWLLATWLGTWLLAGTATAQGPVRPGMPRPGGGPAQQQPRGQPTRGGTSIDEPLTSGAADAKAEAQPQGPPYRPETQPPTVPKTICDGRRIRELRIEGTGRVAKEDMRTTIELEPEMPCSGADVRRDAEALWELGYFDDIVIEGEPVGEDEIDLVYRVEERPAIEKVVFEGNDELDDSELEEKVTLQDGAILSVPDVEEQVDKLRDLYAEEGHFLAKIDYSLEKRPKNSVLVRFDIEEGEEVTVRRVRFVGNEKLDDDEIEAFMQTRETGFFSFLQSNNTFQRDIFDQDLNRIQAVYYDHGYLNVQVGSPRIELTPDRHHIDITIPVTEGPRFKVGRVQIQELGPDGNEVEPLAGRRNLREMVDVMPGDWFSRSTIAQSIQEIQRFYRDHGYAKVHIAPQTQLETDRNVVHLTVQIQRGPLVRVSRIQIKGNTKTRDAVIRREIDLVEGDLYSQSAVEHAKGRIQALGYFESVSVAEEAGADPDEIILNFEVTEKPTGTFQVGAGLSSVESFIFTAQIQQQNLFGRGQSLALQLQLSGIRQIAQLRFIEPYLFGTEWTASAEAFKTVSQYVDFNRDATGGNLTLGHPVFHENLRLFFTYRLEDVNIEPRTGGRFRGRQNYRLTGGGTIHNQIREGLINSLKLSLVWDSRNNRILPSKGVHASFSTEVADRDVLSSYSFVRHRAFGRFYYPLFGNVVAKLNTEWGLITSRDPDGVPGSERFYLGGIFDLRGFILRSLGPRAGLPRNPDPNALVADRGIIMGGNMQLYYNLEVEFPILEMVGIRGVVFTDGGNAWNLEKRLCQAPQAPIRDDVFDNCGVNLLDLRHSWGFGIRWFSPMGPLRFEMGFPFNPRDFEDTRRFEFTIGNFF